MFFIKNQAGLRTWGIALKPSQETFLFLSGKHKCTAFYRYGGSSRFSPDSLFTDYYNRHLIIVNVSGILSYYMLIFHYEPWHMRIIYRITHRKIMLVLHIYFINTVFFYGIYIELDVFVRKSLVMTLSIWLNDKIITQNQNLHRLMARVNHF